MALLSKNTEVTLNSKCLCVVSRARSDIPKSLSVETTIWLVLPAGEFLDLSVLVWGERWKTKSLHDFFNSFIHMCIYSLGHFSHPHDFYA
jgi:hypothetical protein